MGIQHMQRAQFTAKAQREVVEILFLEYQCKNNRKVLCTPISGWDLKLIAERAPKTRAASSAVATDGSSPFTKMSGG